MTEIAPTTVARDTRWWRFLLGPRAGAAADGLSLRKWFALYLVWTVALTALAGEAFARYELGRPGAQSVWLVSMGLFYLSLCCIFFPAPTAWLVMLLASNQVVLIESVPLRVAVVAVACGVATGVANLNEYHIITFILRYGGVARVRNTHAYQVAARWFATSPFAVIVAFGFLPIPVDVVRWLAIACRYPRPLYFAAYVIGRSARYAVWAGSVVYLNWDWWEILIFQAALLLLAGAKVLHAWLRKRGQAPLEAKRSGHSGAPSKQMPGA